MFDQLDELKNELLEVLQSKRDELHLLGYDKVTTDEVWECVLSKNKGNLPTLHQLVNDILSLKPTTFMNWLTMNAFYGKLT